MNKNDFVNSIKEGALRGQADYGILPSLTIAQAILESSYGSSQLAQMAKNLFGIKAYSNWTGKIITLPTLEWYNDKKQVVNEKFKAYDSFDDSIEDHNKLLSLSRYKPLNNIQDYKTACKKVYECGYATDPKYPEKLIKLIEENMLYEFDNRAGSKIRKIQILCNKLSIKDSEGKSLNEDNILGWRTLSCIPKLPILKIGSKGLTVEFVQEALNISPIDGDFGPITKKCIIEYQKNKNLAADGIIGINTWKSLIES